MPGASTRTRAHECYLVQVSRCCGRRFAFRGLPLYLRERSYSPRKSSRSETRRRRPYVEETGGAPIPTFEPFRAIWTTWFPIASTFSLLPLWSGVCRRPSGRANGESAGSEVVTCRVLPEGPVAEIAATVVLMVFTHSEVTVPVWAVVHGRTDACSWARNGTMANSTRPRTMQARSICVRALSLFTLL